MATSLSELSRSSKLFVTVSSDNRIHLWDTVTRKEKRSYVEKNHLQHSYNCCSWKQTEKNPLGLFVVGCSDGSVLLWDFTRGIVVQTIQALENLPVTGISFSVDGTSIYVASNDNYLKSFSVKSGELAKSIKIGKKGVSAMAANPRVDVVAIGSSSIRLVDIESGQKRKLEAEFGGGVSRLAFSDCGCYLAACSTSSREVVVFDVQANAASSAPLIVIPVSGIPVQISVKSLLSEASDDVALCMYVGFENTGGVVIRWPLSQGEDAPLSSTVINCTASLYAACFGLIGDTESTGISFAVGAGAQFVFSHHDYEGNDGSMVKAIDVSSAATASSSSGVVSGAFSTGMSDMDTSTPTMLGALEAGPNKRLHVDESAIIANEETKSKKAKKSKKDAGEEELTLEQRLEQLSETIASVEDASKTLAVTQTKAPTSDSMVVLMEQALQSGDDALLEECFGCEDVDVINTTVSRLPLIRIVPLLKKLVAKFEKRPSRSALMTLWLASILRMHSSFLMSCSDLSLQLAGLSQILEQRLSSYGKLAALGGRLDLLMQQVTSTAAANAPSHRNGASTPARIVQDE